MTDHPSNPSIHQRGAKMPHMVGMLHPFAWGVRTLTIDVDALESGLLRIERCELIFPDGLAVRCPEDTDLSECTFEGAFLAPTDTVGVYVCVRPLDQQSGGVQRYTRRSGSRRDKNDPDSEVQIDIVGPAVELLCTNNPQDERLAGIESLKIAEIRRTGRATPRYELSSDYIPPLVSLDASPVLMGWVRRLHEDVSVAARGLGQQRHQGHNVELLLNLQMLNTFIATVQHALTAWGHPFELYGLLTALRGGLVTYADGEEATAFPAYEHTNLARGFLWVMESIRRTLRQCMPLSYEEIVLQRDGFYFEGRLEPELAEGGRFWLAVRGPDVFDRLTSRIETQAKVGSITNVRGTYVLNALRGVPVHYREYPPSQIPHCAGHSYFEIDVADPRWRSAVESCSFSFYLENAGPDLTVRLFAVRSTPDSKDAANESPRRVRKRTSCWK